MEVSDRAAEFNEQVDDFPAAPVGCGLEQILAIDILFNQKGLVPFSEGTVIQDPNEVRVPQPAQDRELLAQKSHLTLPAILHADDFDGNVPISINQVAGDVYRP
jgi:hypothetical protein